jgi:DnaJ-class molecular chaperone
MAWQKDDKTTTSVNESRTYRQCKICNGLGALHGGECFICNGTGWEIVDNRADNNHTEMLYCPYCGKKLKGGE